MIAAADIKGYVEEVVKRFAAQSVILFGSYAYGTPTADSDVDILVVKPYRGEAQSAPMA